MEYEDWLKSLPAELTGDPLWRMEVYRLALYAADVAWQDVACLAQDQRTLGLSNQLYRSAGSIPANIAEGYSHRSGKDQARFYEYALGSAREARVWYFQARHVISNQLANVRIQLITRIIRLLLTIIPSERGYKMSEDVSEYHVTDLDTPSR